MKESIDNRLGSPGHNSKLKNHPHCLFILLFKKSSVLLLGSPPPTPPFFQTGQRRLVELEKTFPMRGEVWKEEENCGCRRKWDVEGGKTSNSRFWKGKVEIRDHHRQCWNRQTKRRRGAHFDSVDHKEPQTYSVTFFMSSTTLSVRFLVISSTTPGDNLALLSGFSSISLP